MAIRLDWARWGSSVAIAGTAAAIGVLAGLAPALAIVAALSIAFVLVVFADLTMGVVLFTILTFLGLLPTIAGPLVSLPKAAGLLLALSWLALVATRHDTRGNFFAEHRDMTWLGLAFLAWVLLSLVWAESHSAAVTAFFRYALNFALLPIVYAAVRGSKDAVGVSAAFVAGATIAAGYGIASQPDVAAAGTAELDRVSGTVGDPNELAAVLVAALVLGVALWRTRSLTPLLRLAAIAAAGLCAVTIFLTLSRGGLIALAAALLAGVVFGGRSRGVYLVVGLALLLGTVTYFAAVAPPEARDRLTAADGGTGRTDIWKVAWRAVEDKPVAGLGGDNFPVSSVHYLLQPGSLQRSDLIVQTPEVTHNMYLQVLAELGIVGLVLFVALIVAAIRSALLAAREFGRRGDRDMELLARGLIVALCGLLAADFFLSGQYAKQLWLLLALCPALLGVARNGEPAPGPQG